MSITIGRVNIIAKTRKLRENWTIINDDDLSITIVNSHNPKWPFLVYVDGNDNEFDSWVMSSLNSDNYIKSKHGHYKFKFDKDITWMRLRWSNSISE